MSNIQDVVVALYETRGADWKGLGSASIIASFGTKAIFLTARHVLEPIVDEIQRTRPTYPRLSSIKAIVSSGEHMFIAEVSQLQISEFSDIGFGFLTASEGSFFTQGLAVDPSPVLPGTQLCALGYNSLTTDHDQNWNTQEFAVKLKLDLQTRECVSGERALGGIRHLRWPVFKVDTAFDSGMSGGPVIELRGSEPVVRGVICSDISVSDNLSIGSGEAVATELWPTLMLPFQFDLALMDTDGSEIQIATWLDLFQEQVIADRGNTTQCFIWEPDANMVTVSWRGISGQIQAPFE